LVKAHETDSPTRTAQAVLEGWIASHGPAFEKRQERTVDRLLDLASAYGFREVFSRDYYLGECTEAWVRWRRLVRQHERNVCTGQAS
jgi:hypothetical protein